MKKAISLAIILVMLSCKTEVKPEGKLTVENSTKVNIESFNYDGLKILLNKKDNKTYVINFWATWCKPCVEELPSFEKLHKTYKNKNVEVILVSLDFPNHIESKLIPFIKEHNLKPKVVLMADPDQNTWIPKVSTEWSGAIPATVIYNKNYREFYEQSFTYHELENELTKFIKTN